jgi:rhodanese-related sulfurtransferase
VARQMMNQGFERVYVLEGGWDAWEKGDYPMENF